MMPTIAIITLNNLLVRFDITHTAHGCFTPGPGLSETSPHNNKTLRKTAQDRHEDFKIADCFVSLFCQKTASFTRLDVVPMLEVKFV